MPTDLTKLREAWERECDVGSARTWGAFYPRATPDDADDLIQRAYRQGVEDCIAVAKDEAADTIDGPAATALAIVLARLEALKAERKGD